MTKFEPNKFSTGMARLLTVVAVLTSLLAPAIARAGIDGVAGSSFNLSASEGYISIADGGSIYSWGYSTGSSMQLPGPTLIVTQGQTVTVTLNNNLPAAAGNTSIVFPGHQIIATDGGVPGALIQEAAPGGSVEYTFIADKPGTYQYHSGTRPELQVEMGLFGALIVVPDADSVTTAGCALGQPAYGHPGTCFDREYLFLLSEIDIDVHQAAEQQAGGTAPIDVGPGPFHPEYWLLNGRAGPDTMAAAGTDLMPSQPYNSLPRMHPGERLLLRVVGGGRDLHPFHTHGNHARVLARDGRLLLSKTDPTKLAGPLLFTIPSEPGGTVDAVFEWTGKDLGWDIYGTSPGIAVANAGFEDPTLSGWIKSGGEILQPSNPLNRTEGIQSFRFRSDGSVEQQLGDVLKEGTYSLRVDVGDQGSTTIFIADYQVQLGVMQGTTFVLLAEDNDYLSPDQGFLTSTVEYTAAAGDPSLGLPLVIRLIATNTSATAWVLFDDVRLDYATHDCDTPGGYHSVVTDPNYLEWCDDHGRPIPVELPNLTSLAFGGFYSGSPYLGALGSLPPGEGGLNPNAGFAYMWHSHTERELVNNDVFPGGLMTMLIIEAPSVEIIE